MKKLSTILLSIMLVLTFSSSMVFADEVDARITDVRVSNTNEPEDYTEKPGFIREHDPTKIKFNIKVNKEVKEGDHFDINLSENYDLTTDATYQKNIDVVDNDGEVIGKVDITANETSATTGGGVARVTFNDKVKNKIVNNINLTFFGMFNNYRVKGNSDVRPLYYDMYATINGHLKNHSSAVITENENIKQGALALSRELNNNTDKITWYANVNRKKNYQLSSNITFSVENWGGNLELVGRVLRQEVEYNDRGQVTKIYNSTDITDKVVYSDDRTELTYDTNRLYAKSTRFVFETKTAKGDKSSHVLARIRFTSGQGTSAFRSGGSERIYVRPTVTKAVASITRIAIPEPEHPTEPENPVEPQEPETPAQPENPNPSVTPSEPGHNPNVVIRGEEEIVNPYSSVRAEENITTTNTETNKADNVVTAKKTSSIAPKTADDTNLTALIACFIIPLILLSLVVVYARKHK